MLFNISVCFYNSVHIKYISKYFALILFVNKMCFLFLFYIIFYFFKVTSVPNMGLKPTIPTSRVFHPTD